MPSEFTMQQKIKVITKLTESGYDTEKKLQKLEMENILQIKGITIPEMSIEYSGVAEPCFPLKEPPNIPVKRANLSANESQ